ncbi:hypothetical protein BJY04DRAFT_1037 [Aspergillus karnatakaensis]|uniref:uncharacterized protein n=1 Tax=Aspergillus karnatakaensis TaxID=1810916 RepID=UPI003CCD0399
MFSFLLLTWLFVGALAVDDGKTYFTNPPPLVSVQDAVKDMPAYELGSIQKITWMTTLNVFNISIWQRLGNDRNLRGGNIYGLSIALLPRPQLIERSINSKNTALEYRPNLLSLLGGPAILIRPRLIHRLLPSHRIDPGFLDDYLLQHHSIIIILLLTFTLLFVNRE